MKKTIVLGSDHGGFVYKKALIDHLEKQGYATIDVGTHSEVSCNYPDYAHQAAIKVANQEADFGVVICNTGIGVSIVANKVKSIRCAVGYDDEVVRLTRQHNDANMLAFGAHFMSLGDIIRRIDIFLNTPFEGGRHQVRVDLIKHYEQ